MQEQPYVPAAYPGARVRYRYGERSERTGRTAGEHVVWSIPEGHDTYPAGSGAEMSYKVIAPLVIVPNDGGFVWLLHEGGQHIVPAEFVRPVE